MFKFFGNFISSFNLLFRTLNGAREYLENRIADVLDKVQDSEPIDSIEKRLITTGLNAGLTYFCGNCPLGAEELNIISDSIVEKGINKINPIVSKQLRK